VARPLRRRLLELLRCLQCGIGSLCALRTGTLTS
jgi:hypothetical protein